MGTWLIAAALAFGADLSVGEFNKYLYPSETGFLAFFDLRIAQQSGFFDKQLEEGFDQLLQGNEQLRQLSELLEFDPIKQVHRVTICGGGQQSDQSFLVIINGDFPFDKSTEVLDKLVDDGQLSVFDILEMKVYYNHRERQAMYFAVIDQHTVIASPSKKWTEDALLGLSEFRSLDTDVIKRSQWQVSEPSQFMRLAGTFPEQARKQLARNPQFGALAEKLVGFNMSVQLIESPRIRVRLSMVDAQAADQMALILNTLVRLGEAALANSPRQDLLQMLQKLSIKPEEEHILADVQVTRALFEQIMENNKEDRQRRMDERRRRREQRETEAENGGVKKEEPGQ